MAEAGYKNLLTYKLAVIAFDLGWDFVPQYYNLMEDHRQRDQIKQALRSHKQNIVEGSSERSLSSKLKLYDVAKSSGVEAFEDCGDILRLERLPRWQKNDPRLSKLHQKIEGFSSSPSNPSSSSLLFFVTAAIVLETLGIRGNRRIRRGEKQAEVEAIVNYLIDVLARAGYLLDRQINAVEERHKTIGGYTENLYKKRIDYLRNKN